MSQKPIQLEIFEADRSNKESVRTLKTIPEKIVGAKFPTQFCIKTACLLILIIISFTLGVERGKIISSKKDPSSTFSENKKIGITKEIAKDSLIKEEKVEAQETSVVLKRLEKKEGDSELSATEYIIQVATYRKNSSYIEKEVGKLKNNGYNTLLVSSGDYTGVCAGKFANKKEAQTQLNELKRIYKDCFIRKI